MDLAQAAFAIIRRIQFPDYDVKDVWILHDDRCLADMASTPKAKKLQLVREYYGTKVSTYFGLLQFYAKYLETPAFAGAIFFLHQWYLGTIDTPLLPCFGIMMTIWSTLFTEVWKRKNAELSYVWGVFGIEEREASKDLVKVKLFSAKSKLTLL